jgi:hypothetical protein
MFCRTKHVARYHTPFILNKWVIALHLALQNLILMPTSQSEGAGTRERDIASRCHSGLFGVSAGDSVEVW